MYHELGQIWASNAEECHGYRGCDSLGRGFPLHALALLAILVDALQVRDCSTRASAVADHCLPVFVFSAQVAQL